MFVKLTSDAAIVSDPGNLNELYVLTDLPTVTATGVSSRESGPAHRAAASVLSMLARPSQCEVPGPS
jgi:hypothetical protein